MRLLPLRGGLVKRVTSFMPLFLRNFLRKNITAFEYHLRYSREERKIANLRDGCPEREVAPDLSGIPRSHQGRYRFSCHRIPGDARVLDAACGIGYGAYILATESRAASITALDISKQGIAYGRRHYSAPEIDFGVTDITALNLKEDTFDVIVSFETIEHVKAPKSVLRSFHESLAEDGILIVSVPNEVLLPFNRETYVHHERHYTPDELCKLVESCGFRVERIFAQGDDDMIREGENGKTILVEARKARHHSTEK